MSFAGRGILVTRPRELAEGLATLIEHRGARAIRFAAIEIEPLAPPPALSRPADYQVVVFVSPSAVRTALPSMPAWPASVAAAAIGAGTRRELELAGIAPILSPLEGADSESLLALPAMQEVAGKRILIVRGQGGRAFLGDTLRQRGASVEYAECYRRAPPAGDAAKLLAAWRGGGIDAVTISSSEALDNLLPLAGGLLERTPLFVPHPRVAQHARNAGVREVLVAGASDDAVLERLVAYFDARD